MSSRQYIKRVWRVPKDDGAQTYLMALLVKVLVKHGWPAMGQHVPSAGGFEILVAGTLAFPQPDFLRAIEISCRILARTYRLDLANYENFVALGADYTVTAGGHFKQVKHD